MRIRNAHKTKPCTIPAVLNARARVGPEARRAPRATQRPRDRDRMAGPFRGDVGRLVRPAYRFFEGNHGRAGAVAESGIATIISTV